MPVIQYAETLYADDSVEREVYGPGVDIRWGPGRLLAEIPDEDAAVAEGLLVFGNWISATDLERFPRLAVVVRMGVGYDRIDRTACAARNVMVCNVPDYGTMEVAEHAVVAALALRRGLVLYLDTQRHEPPAPWKAISAPALIRRTEGQCFGVLGLGRIGTAAALRAKALGFRVVFYDPYRPNGADRAIGVERALTLEALLRQADVLTVHTPLTPETTGMLGLEQLSLLPEGAIVVNTARGPIVDLAALETLLREGRLAGAALDVLAVEPPVDPVPDLLRAYRAREGWLEGRLLITPHSSYHTPQSWDDIRRKSAETMAAALLAQAPQNVIAPDSW
jgi:phosphoglycerate dehydrogenase-like enzyme